MIKVCVCMVRSVSDSNRECDGGCEIWPPTVSSSTYISLSVTLSPPASASLSLRLYVCPVYAPLIYFVNLLLFLKPWHCTACLYSSSNQSHKTLLCGVCVKCVCRCPYIVFSRVFMSLQGRVKFEK